MKFDIESAELESDLCFSGSQKQGRMECKATKTIICNSHELMQLLSKEDAVSKSGKNRIGMKLMHAI